MPRPVDTSYSEDPEYIQFTDMIKAKDLSVATAKSYKASYRKVRNLFDKPIRDCAEDTAVKAILASEENINSQQALINVCVLTRLLEPAMPIDVFHEQRDTNKKDVREHLQQANSFKVLPSLEEFDAFIENLWQKGLYREYIINYLIRYHYVRNLDCIFDIVATKQETLADKTKNYLWMNKRNLSVVYIRNNYKTFKTYGQKSVEIKNERFIKSVKVCFKQMYAFPITEDPALIGYHINRMTMPYGGARLGESNCLKIIINHYRSNYQKIEEISRSRGTNTQTLMTSYNISYNGITE